jgi:hypothetical protein
MTFVEWYGLYAPARTPRQILDRLSDALQRALDNVLEMMRHAAGHAGVLEDLLERAAVEPVRLVALAVRLVEDVLDAARHLPKNLQGAHSSWRSTASPRRSARG